MCTVICPVHADLDIDAAGVCAAGLRAAIRLAPDVPVLDLGGAGFCESIGSNVLVRVRSDCGHRGVSLRPAAVGPQVRRLLEIVGADRVFELFANAAAAAAVWDTPGVTLFGPSEPGSGYRNTEARGQLWQMIFDGPRAV